MAILIIAGSIPLILFGFLLYKTNLIYYLRNIETIAWATLIFGIILYFSDKIKVKKKFDDLDSNNQKLFKELLSYEDVEVFDLKAAKREQAFECTDRGLPQQTFADSQVKQCFPSQAEGAQSPQENMRLNQTLQKRLRK